MSMDGSCQRSNEAFMAKMYLTWFRQYPGLAVQEVITLPNSAYLDYTRKFPRITLHKHWLFPGLCRIIPATQKYQIYAEDLCEMFLLILVESNFSTIGCLISVVYGIALLQGNAIILNLSQYCLHQMPSSSLIKDHMTTLEQERYLAWLVIQVQPETCSHQDNQCYHKDYHIGHQDYIQKSRWVPR